MRSAQAAVDILSSQAALLGPEGVIVAVNKGWRDFSAANGGRGDYVGINYLDVCRRSADIGSREAARAYKGLRRIVAGASDDYGLAYECQGKIFRLRAKAIRSDDERQVLVAHEDISELVKAQMALRLARAGEARLAEELGQRLAAISLAIHVLKREGATERAISTIELALEEARREVKRLRRGPDDFED